MIVLNDKPINITSFPNGESCIKHLDVRQHNDLWLYYRSDVDLIHLQMIKDAIDEHDNDIYTTLWIAYMPYERMDRANSEYLFTLKTVSKLINNMRFSYVVVIEPHSDVCMGLLDRSHAIPAVERLIGLVMDTINFDSNRDYLVFPDQGAEKRYNFGGYKTIVGVKQRDFASGDITGIRLITPTPFNPTAYFKVLVVDDLCSKGTTFVEVAKEMEKYNHLDDLHLLVAHVEPNIYNGKVFDHYSSVHATDSLQDRALHKSLTLHPLQGLVR